jgi:hypothetical protein
VSSSYSLHQDADGDDSAEAEDDEDSDSDGNADDSDNDGEDGSENDDDEEEEEESEEGDEDDNDEDEEDEEDEDGDEEDEEDEDVSSGESDLDDDIAIKSTRDHSARPRDSAKRPDVDTRLPSFVDVPATDEALRGLLAQYSVDDKRVILERMRKSHPLAAGAGHREALERFVEFLVPYVFDAAADSSLLVEDVYKHVNELADTFPEATARGAKSLLQRMWDSVAGTFGT